jgi:hypothetical protein
VGRRLATDVDAAGPVQPGKWCRQAGCQPVWFRLDEDVSVRQCKRCGTVSSVFTRKPHGLRHLRWIEALQSTAGKPSEDFYGCTD